MIHATGQLEASKTHKVRSWSFLAVTGGDHLGTLTIRQGTKADAYDVEEDASFQAGGVRTFILRKQNEPETFYEVVCQPLKGHPEPGRVRCNCSGFGRWGHCKHSDAIAEALDDGVLDIDPCTEIGEWFERIANPEGPIDQPEPDDGYFRRGGGPLAMDPTCHGCDDSGKCPTCDGTSGYPAASCGHCFGTGYCPYCRAKEIENPELYAPVARRVPYRTMGHGDHSCEFTAEEFEHGGQLFELALSLDFVVTPGEKGDTDTPGTADGFDVRAVTVTGGNVGDNCDELTPAERKDLTEIVWKRYHDDAKFAAVLDAACERTLSR